MLSRQPCKILDWSWHGDRNNGTSEANDPVGEGKKKGKIALNNREGDRSAGRDRRARSHLGDVLDLGEPEGHPEAAEEHGDEGTGVAEGREAELPAVGLHPARQLLERLGHRRQRRLHPLARCHNGRRPFAKLLRRRLRLRRRRPRHLPEPEHPVPSSPFLLPPSLSLSLPPGNARPLAGATEGGEGRAARCAIAPPPRAACWAVWGVPGGRGEGEWKAGCLCIGGGRKRNSAVGEKEDSRFGESVPIPTLYSHLVGNCRIEKTMDGERRWWSPNRTGSDWESGRGRLPERVAKIRLFFHFHFRDVEFSGCSSVLILERTGYGNLTHPSQSESFFLPHYNCLWICLLNYFHLRKTHANTMTSRESLNLSH